MCLATGQIIEEWPPAFEPEENIQFNSSQEVASIMQLS